MVANRTFCLMDREHDVHTYSLARIDDFNKSADLGYKFGLVTTDSYHAAAMYRSRLKQIASNDSDFGRVDFIEVWTL